jgi:hypothetical protein
MNKKEKKKQYIEMKVINKNDLILSIVFYPLIVLMGISIFSLSLVKYTFKLIGFLIMCLIPVFNLSTITNFDNLPDGVDNFYENESPFLDIIHETKRFEIKDGVVK